MRVLVYGAGVIGSIFAGKLAASGCEVSLLARGNRLRELEDSGLMLRNALSGKLETYRLPLVSELREDDVYDYVIVAVQNGQIGEILPRLGSNKSRAFVFVVNNPLGFEAYARAVGRERVMIGFPSAGGERKDGIVSCFIGKGPAKAFQSTTFGELDGRKTERLARLLGLFRKAGFSPAWSRDMDAWQKTHVALVLPISLALYACGADNYRLARSKDLVRDMVLATREGFEILKARGGSVEPGKLNFYYLPLGLVSFLFQAILGTKIAEFSMSKHAAVAREEISLLHKQFLSLNGGRVPEAWARLGKAAGF